MKHILGFLKTQPLWKNEQFGLRQFEMPDIDIHTFYPAPIPTNIRLGHQVEHIYKQLLNHTGRYDVIAHNIQLKKEKKTIGEIDFIVEDCHFDAVQNKFRESGKKFIHIELTYKFYIIDPIISDPINRLIGPNRKDMFFTKMEKTRDRQLPLLFSLEGKEALSSYSINSNDIEQQTYFLGQLYTPYGMAAPSIPPLNAGCIEGFWVTMKEFDSAHFRESLFYIPLKYEWLHIPHGDVAWGSHINILMDINMLHINKSAPMIWVKHPNGTIEKGFVVWW